MSTFVTLSQKYFLLVVTSLFIVFYFLFEVSTVIQKWSKIEVGLHFFKSQSQPQS